MTLRAAQPVHGVDHPRIAVGHRLRQQVLPATPLPA